MKLLTDWMEQLSRWVDNYGWVIPTFAWGVAVGLIVVSIDVNDRDFYLAVLTTIGTVGAAGAALWTTRLSRETLDKQLSNEQELKQPNLVLSNIDLEQKPYEYRAHEGRYHGTFRFHIELTNLGEFPIYVREITTTLGWGTVWLVKRGLDEVADDEYERRGFLVPPNTSVQRILQCGSPIPNEGEEAVQGSFTFAFQYGPTARRMHTLEPRVSIISYDMDHVLEGEMNIEIDGDVHRKRLEMGYNRNRVEDDPEQ